MSNTFPEFYYRDSSVFNKINKMYYNDSGTWLELREVWYNDNGTWTRVFSNEAIVITNQTAFDDADTSGGSATAETSYSLASDGRARKNLGVDVIPGEWYSNAPVTGFGADYEARATVTFDNGNGTLGGSPTGSWESLTSGLQWTLADTGNFVERTSIRDLLIEISDDGGTTVIASAEITLRTRLFGP